MIFLVGGLMSVTPSFAWELNSGNIATYCNTGVTNCFFADTGVTSIAPYTFSGYSNMTTLTLGDKQISSIASGAFNGLSALTALNLDNNQIVTINSGAFNGLSALTTLYLTKNQIVTINSGAFNGLSALNYLNLYNNQIVTINSGAFNGLSALTALNLDNNQISSVCSGSLIGLSALTTLYLNSNQIVTINSGTFNGLTALTTLELSNNEIKSIRNIQLTGPTNLNSLYLAANYIESIKQSDLIGLENLKTLEISNSMQGVGNPILDIEIGAFDNLTSLNDLSLSDGCLDFENNPALENYLTGISLGGLHSVNISNQKVCLTMIYTPSSSTTANVVGTYALTGGTASNRAIILIQNPGLTGMTHTWTTNGIYYTGLSGISDPSSLLNQTSLMSNYYRPRSSLPIGEVTWILSDNTAPTAIVEYNTTSSTTQNVIATITGFSESIIGLNETNHTFTENGNFVFTFSDLAGNTGSTTATVNRIYRSSGGGSTTTKDSCPNGDLSSSYYDGSCGTTPDIQTPGIQTDTTSLDELISAYNWSYSQGITTMKSVKLARIQDQLTRAEMAKMIVNYATTSLGKTADTTKQVSFDDLKGQTTEMKEYITKAYQLGLMGVNTENFNPNDLVTRAEFGTVLARLLYGTVSDVDQLYYTKPLATLREKGIIKNTNPLLQEARGYVMLMLMRASK